MGESERQGPEDPEKRNEPGREQSPPKDPADRPSAPPPASRPGDGAGNVPNPKQP